MTRVLRTPQANEDLIGISDYSARERERPAAADRVLRKLDATVEMPAQDPLLGESAERYCHGLRMFPRWQYIIFYEPIEDGILVHRILHGARRLEDLL